MSQAAAETGVGPTVMVAIEQSFPVAQRILDDHLARSILPLGMRTFVRFIGTAFLRDLMVKALEKSAPGIWAGIMCRKRHIDEKVIDAVRNIEASVNLGAGFDTRVYRLPAIGDTAAWGIDQPRNIKIKRARLIQLFGKLPEHVTFVPVDFDREDLGVILAAHGYSADKRTFFIWEAVTQYLTDDAVAGTFDFLSKATVGSRLAFTYIRKDFIEGRAMYRQEQLYKKYVLRHKIWLFGIDPGGVPDLLGKYGWRVVEHPTYEELADGYVKPTARGLTSTRIEQVVYAEKL